MHEGERERSPDHAREIVQYATLSHIYSYTGIARVLLCHGRKLSRIATCLNCDSRDEYYIRPSRLPRLYPRLLSPQKSLADCFGKFCIVRKFSFLNRIDSLSLLRAVLRETLLEVSRLTNAVDI